MNKINLITLCLIASICGGCKSSPLIQADVTTKVPFISVGNKYIFYNSWGLEPGIVQCDTVEVTGIDNNCIHFCKDNKEYIIDKRKFKYRMVPVNKKPRK